MVSVRTVGVGWRPFTLGLLGHHHRKGWGIARPVAHILLVIWRSSGAT